MSDAGDVATAAPAFNRLPSHLNAAGTARRVGFEIEFMGLSARAAASALALGLHGAAHEEDPHAFSISGTPLGDLTVELDLRYAHPHRHGDKLPIRLGARSGAWLGSVLHRFVPRELITSPVPVERFPDVDEVIEILRRAGAKGDGSVLFESLGLHFNIEPASLEPDAITAVLKAFLLLEGRLRHEVAGGRPRLARVLPPAYPDGYIRRVVAPDYWPDLVRLTDDYLAANPSRRRALDLLPLLLHFDEPRVRAAAPDEKIAKRMAFHYRLPLAHLSTPGWSIAPDWNRWVEVEALASDRAALARLGRAYLDASSRNNASTPVGR